MIHWTYFRAIRKQSRSAAAVSTVRPVREDQIVVRTDDELMRSMVEISGDMASIYKGPMPDHRSPVFVALHWWLSLEDTNDPGNQATLDYLTCSTGWDDYDDAAAAIGQSAICMTATYDDTNENVAYVRFVPPCIDAGATAAVVPPDDNHYLTLVNTLRPTTRWDDDKQWMVWRLSRDARPPRRRGTSRAW